MRNTFRSVFRTGCTTGPGVLKQAHSHVAHAIALTPKTLVGGTPQAKLPELPRTLSVKAVQQTTALMPSAERPVTSDRSTIGRAAGRGVRLH